MDSSLLIIILGAAAFFMLSKKDNASKGGDNSKGGDSDKGGDSKDPSKPTPPPIIDPSKPTPPPIIDPSIPKPGEFDENDEIPGVKCGGCFYFGNISWDESQGQFRLQVENKSKIDYKIVGADVTVYYQGVMVGFKDSLKLEGLNYTLMQGKTLDIDFPHTPVYFTTKRQALYNSLPKNGLGLNKTDQELGKIFRADVRLYWTLRKGANMGNPYEAYYQEVLINGVFRSDHFYF